MMAGIRAQELRDNPDSSFRGCSVVTDPENVESGRVIPLIARRSAMVSTTKPLHTEVTTLRITPRRVAAVAAAVLGLSLFLTVAVLEVPNGAGDAQLLRWWHEQSNRTAGIYSGLSAIAVAIAAPVAVNFLLDLPSAAGAPHLRAFVRSMVGAVTALWLVTGAVRAAIGRFVDISGERLPGPDTLRLATALNYSLLGLAGMAALSLAILAISVLVLRTALLATWVGYVGLACGLPMLASVIAQYGAYTTALGVIWAFCLAAALWRGLDEPATGPTPPRTA